MKKNMGIKNKGKGHDVKQCPYCFADRNTDGTCSNSKCKSKKKLNN